MPTPPRLPAGQSCRVFVYDVATGERQLIHETRELLLEAPNWAPSGDLILNGDGKLWTLQPEPGAVPKPIEIDGIPDLNNDHVLAPDGATIYLSAMDWHIYVAPLAGGTARRVTTDDGLMHFLHGVSPDGAELAYIGIVTPLPGQPRRGATVRTLRVEGGEDVALESGGAPADGSEYSPDGAWIYFNTELFEPEPGHAQVARMRPDGTAVEQLTSDDRVNWFPHISPDGRLIVYLSYPTGTTGHPGNLPVELVLVRDDDWGASEVVVSLFGGQGTINVNSWSPDSTRFAYVDYPIGQPLA